MDNSDTMSLPDGELEEPSDEEYCSIHARYKSRRGCVECEADEADRQYNTRRESL